MHITFAFNSFAFRMICVLLTLSAFHLYSKSIAYTFRSICINDSQALCVIRLVHLVLFPLFFVIFQYLHIVYLPFNFIFFFLLLLIVSLYRHKHDEYMRIRFRILNTQISSSQVNDFILYSAIIIILRTFFRFHVELFYH